MYLNEALSPQARKEVLSARRKALLNSLFEMWDNDGSGFLDLDEVETVMKKYKDGVEMDAIAKGLYSNASPYLRCAGQGEGGGLQVLWIVQIFTVHKRSLGQGNIFTPVCDSVHRDGGLLPGGGVWWRPPRTATAAGGTHPTGMHSCIMVHSY